MKYGSVCSGVEAATVAWDGLGWKPQWFSEIEQFPSAVLDHHYPGVPNMGDMTKHKEWNNGAIDLLVGGTPCQSFSVAGLRKGLDDPRGNLMLTYLAIAEQYRAKWLVWENVPGVLSSNGGKDFGAFLGALGQLGYGFAYRVLDAQYFGVPQRRKRVFVVGCLGDWRSAAAVLFESHSLQGHSAPSREKGKKPSPSVTTGAPFSRTGNERVECDAIIPFDTTQITSPANGSHPKPGDPCHPLAAGAHAPTIVPYTASSFGGYKEGVGTIRAAGGDLGGGSETLAVPMIPTISATLQTTCGDWSRADGFTMIPVAQATAETTLSDVTMSITASYGSGGADLATKPMVCAPLNTMTMMGRPSDKGRMGLGVGEIGDPCPTITVGHSHAAIADMAVRRLTPTECERLQGFPDNYTQIPYRKKDADNCPDSPRYKAMGNSMAVPVMKWIGERIEMVEGAN